MKYKLRGDNNYIDITKTVFANRGITNVYNYLNPTIEDTHSWKLLDNIGTGVKMLRDALEKDKKIHIIVDSDCDGYTSFAVLFNYIKSIYPDAKITYHTHATKTHGIILEDLEKLDYDFDLLIVPDGGTNDHEQIKALYKMGFEVLILDHHEGTKSPLGCTINPQLDNYPNKEISGAMVVYKFCEAMDQLLGISNADQFLDLAVVGLIGDMMNTTVPENRYYIERLLNEPIKNKFLQKIIEKQSYSIGDKLTVKGVAFYIAPLINACTRIGEMKDKMDTILSFIDTETMTVYTDRQKKEHMMCLYEDMPRRLSNLKAKQDRAKNKMLGFTGYLYNGYISILKTDDVLTKGLVANETASSMRKPAMVIVQEGDVYKGSARGYERHYIEDFKSLVDESGCFDLAEGHPNAFGIEFKVDKLQTFIDFIENKFKGRDLSKTHVVDFEISATNLNKQICSELATFTSLWGRGFELPQIAIKKAQCTDFFLNEKVFKFNFKGIDYVMFKPQFKEEDLQGKTTIFNIIGEAGLNTYNGETNGQVVILDYEILEEAKKEFVF